MKVTVKDKFLNVRVGKPSVNAPCFQFIAPGSEIEVDGKLYKGDLFRDIDIWLRDEADNYYWSGGVSQGALVGRRLDTAHFIPEKMSWGHKRFDIPFIWQELSTKGEGVTVALIDTGIEPGNDFSNIHPSSRSFLGDNEIKDINGHGTRMAGIIGANGTDKVFGVSPDVKLLILRATPQQSETNFDGFTRAVNFAASLPEVDIISISYSFTLDNPLFKAAIQDAVSAGKIIVSAIGNNHNPASVNTPDRNTFPSCYSPAFPAKNGLLSIGAFDESGNLVSFSNWSNHLRCLAPGKSVLTTNIGQTTKAENGTSIATAFTVGCLALMLSYAKKHQLTVDCVDVLINSCDDTGTDTGFDIKQGYGLININNAISKIKIP